MQSLIEWILDSGALRHFCANKELMIYFEDVVDEQCVYTGNSSTAAVKGKGKILLKFTSEKMLSLSNILFVTSLRRNLVSSTLLDIVRLKLVQEAGKVVIIRNVNFVRKRYRSERLLVLNATA